MEHNQSVHSKSLKQKIYPSKLRQNLKNTESWDTLKRIYYHYHWLFLFSLLFIFLGSSAIALYSLGYVETAKRKQPEPLQAEVVKPISTKNDRENRIPMWSIVAIAVSCASGCLIVVRFLNRPTYQPRTKQRLKNRTLRYKHEGQSKKLEILKNKGLTTLATSGVNRKTGQTVVKNSTLMTVIPPNSKLNPIQNQLQVANMVNMPSKNPLPPLLQKPTGR
ncbi:MAG: hypothetical protein QNJ36_12290 [Calothrix sp. MO_167.B42]|nr:hypothetical protein [Calothrix sp. MO_167.B42]